MQTITDIAAIVQEHIGADARLLSATGDKRGITLVYRADAVSYHLTFDDTGTFLGYGIS